MRISLTFCMPNNMLSRSLIKDQLPVIFVVSRKRIILYNTITVNFTFSCFFLHGRVRRSYIFFEKLCLADEKISSNYLFQQSKIPTGIIIFLSTCYKQR